MKVKDIFKDKQVKIFVVTDEESDNQLEWTIEPTNLNIIPEDEQTYFVKAKQVFKDKSIDCYISIVTPERIADFVINLGDNGKTISENMHEQENSIIPAVASDCFGIYELYYAKENPQVGIDILKDGLTKARNKNVVAEDLGYILRDENRIEEAIEAFLISEQNQPSSEFIYSELSRLYGLIGQADKQQEYQIKYKKNGGL
jgi:tetratricopeptide (TPR) repeat protein